MSDTAEQYDRVFDVYAPIAIGVFVVIAMTVGFLVFRYRARGRDEFTGGTDSRVGLELGYAAALMVVAALLVWLTFDANDEIEAQFDAPAELEVEVTASRWNWRFAYPGDVVEQGGGTRIPVLRVPAGEPVDFAGTSLDVIHSFWIPEERFKRDLLPEQTTEWQLRFDDPGFHEVGGKCAEFCGLRHADMRFNVEVLEPAEFDRWLAAAGERGAGS